MQTEVNRQILIVLGIIFVLSAFSAVEPLFGRQEFVAEITWIDAARECRSDRSRIFGKRTRSTIPERSPSPYCGIIMSTHGSFKLPPDSFLSGGRRQILFDELKEGCTYEFTISGYGAELFEGSYASTSQHKYIRKAHQIGCE